MEARLTETPIRRRFRRTNHIGRNILSVAIMAGWIAMPLMPVLAFAFSWFSGLS